MTKVRLLLRVTHSPKSPRKTTHDNHCHTRAFLCIKHLPYFGVRYEFPGFEVTVRLLRSHNQISSFCFIVHAYGRTWRHTTHSKRHLLVSLQRSWYQFCSTIWRSWWSWYQFCWKYFCLTKPVLLSNLRASESVDGRAQNEAQKHSYLYIQIFDKCSAATSDKPLYALLYFKYRWNLLLHYVITSSKHMQSNSAKMKKTKAQ